MPGYLRPHPYRSSRQQQPVFTLVASARISVQMAPRLFRSASRTMGTCGRRAVTIALWVVRRMPAPAVARYPADKLRSSRCVPFVKSAITPSPRKYVLARPDAYPPSHPGTTGCRSVTAIACRGHNTHRIPQYSLERVPLGRTVESFYPRWSTRMTPQVRTHLEPGWRLHRDADVYVIVLTDQVREPAGVHAWADRQRQGTRVISS
jgi:hypothetical protein